MGLDDGLPECVQIRQLIQMLKTLRRMLEAGYYFCGFQFLVLKQFPVGRQGFAEITIVYEFFGCLECIGLVGSLQIACIKKQYECDTAQQC
tara:strand:+ start:116 stop:388 length:273 start_codon:yes stop_codon:yes gene_type:complete